MENTPPKWLMIAAIVLVLWNAMGAVMFTMDMMKTPADIAALPQDQQLLWSQLPAWGWFGYGMGTISGLLAAIGIAMKKRWAVWLAQLSVFGIILNFAGPFLISEGVDVYQPKFYGLPLFVFAMSLVQLWLARKANAAGWTS